MTDLERALLSCEKHAIKLARLQGAEEMRERAAQRAEDLWFDARDTEWDEGVNCAKRRVAHAIRALPLTPEEPK